MPTQTKTATSVVEDSSVTFIAGEPPVIRSRGRKRNPVHTKIYNELSSHLGIWGKLNISIIDVASKKRIEASLRSRASKDGFKLSVISSFNEVTKNFDVWMKLYR